MTTESPTAWPVITKTQLMHDIEAEHGGTDIRDLVLEALEKHTRDRLAAASLGILASTMSHWIPKLGIMAQAMLIREARRVA